VLRRRDHVRMKCYYLYSYLRFTHKG
jgi:hypothetical protein